MGLFFDPLYYYTTYINMVFAGLLRWVTGNNPDVSEDLPELPGIWTIRGFFCSGGIFTF